jgi:hypothetical protein
VRGPGLQFIQLALAEGVERHRREMVHRHLLEGLARAATGAST